MNSILSWFRRSKPNPVDLSTPHVRAQVKLDSKERNHQRLVRAWQTAAAGAFLLACGSGYGNYWQLNRAEVEYQFTVYSNTYQPVPFLVRRASVISNLDPQKQGIVGMVLNRYIELWRLRIMEGNFLIRQLNQARSMIAGPALGKFDAWYKDTDPVNKSEREKVVVRVSESPPMPVSQMPSENTWEAAWTEELQDRNGVVLGTQNCTGHFRIKYDPKFADPLNVFGAVVIDQTEQCGKGAPQGRVQGGNYASK